MHGKWTQCPIVGPRSIEGEDGDTGRGRTVLREKAVLHLGWWIQRAHGLIGGKFHGAHVCLRYLALTRMWSIM